MEKTHTDAFKSALPEWSEALTRGMRVVELEEIYDCELQRRIICRKTAKDRATTRWTQARARKAEARALLTEASEDYKKYLKQQARIRMAQEQEREDSLNHGVVVKDDGPADIPRDIRWVYEHLGDLFSVTDKGTRVFNTEVLENAPSNGAVAMANYALLDQKAFFDKFVSRLIPKDAAVTEEEAMQTDAEKMMELDPSFEDMRDFFTTPDNNEPDGAPV